MSQVQTEFWHLQEQDEGIAPTFIESLMEYALQHPNAAAVFADVLTFGTWESKITMSSVIGSPVMREMKLIHEHFQGVAPLGLIRTEALRMCGGLPGNESENFAADTALMAGLARWANYIRYLWNFIESGFTLTTLTRRGGSGRSTGVGKPGKHTASVCSNRRCKSTRRHKTTACYGLRSLNVLSHPKQPSFSFPSLNSQPPNAPTGLPCSSSWHGPRRLISPVPWTLRGMKSIDGLKTFIGRGVKPICSRTQVDYPIIFETQKKLVIM